ncbi:MAG: hypothetical protein K2G30_09650, partial [Muribaculaceae bacterium]|nr:hypothetical protein [Muribaculaceae bacterium]
MTAAIFGLWRNWAVAVGLLTVLVFLSPLIPLQWLPPVNVLFYFALQVVRRYLTSRRVPTCGRFLQEVSVVMLITALFVIGLYFMGRRADLHEFTGQPYDASVPVIAILVTAPVTCIVTGLYLLNRREPWICVNCHANYGNVVEFGFIGDLYRREWRYQTRLLFGLSALLSVVDWAYYLTYYVNVNLNRADLFFFLWMPMVMYVLSLVYLGSRYYSLWTYYCRNDEGHFVENPGTTTVRYIVLCDDRILLDSVPADDKFSNGSAVKFIDSPVVVKLPYTRRVSAMEAAQHFRSRTGINDAEVRLAYESPDHVTFQNIFHFFAFLPDPDEVVDSRIHGEWFTLGHLRQLINQHIVSRNLISEMRRIVTVAMAWKTYDENGRRLYGIKHYRPTFRLRDLHKWQVDYTDKRWLEVALLNQDSTLFGLRRIWRK